MTVQTIREEYIYSERPHPTKSTTTTEKCDLLIKVTTKDPAKATTAEAEATAKQAKVANIDQVEWYAVELKCDSSYNSKNFMKNRMEDREMVQNAAIKPEYSPCTLWAFAISMNDSNKASAQAVINTGQKAKQPVLQVDWSRIGRRTTTLIFVCGNLASLQLSSRLQRTRGQAPSR